MVRRQENERGWLPGTLQTPWIWATLLALLTVSILFCRPAGTPAESNSISLTATDQSGKMQVSWDNHNPTVRSAETGMLDVVDGGELTHYRVATSVLQSGKLEYLRKSDDVLLKLIVYRDGRPELQPMLRSVGYNPQDQEPTSKAVRVVSTRGTRARHR